MSVLIVEDEALADGLRYNLEAEGYEVRRLEPLKRLLRIVKESRITML